MDLSLFTKVRLPLEPLSYKTCTFFLFTVLVTAVVGVTILRITPHHSYYCCGATFRWIGSSWSTVINM